MTCFAPIFFFTISEHITMAEFSQVHLGMVADVQQSEKVFCKCEYVLLCNGLTIKKYAMIFIQQDEKDLVNMFMGGYSFVTNDGSFSVTCKICNNFGIGKV